MPYVFRASTPIAALQRELGITMLYATCSTTDAWVFADQVAMLDRGVLQQTGAPLSVFERPETVAVAQFVGSPPMNLIEAPVEAGIARLGGQRIELAQKALDALTGDRIVIGLRPEDLIIMGDGSDAGVRATAVLVKDTGRDYLTHARSNWRAAPSNSSCGTPTGRRVPWRAAGAGRRYRSRTPVRCEIGPPASRLTHFAVQRTS